MITPPFIEPYGMRSRAFKPDPSRCLFIIRLQSSCGLPLGTIRKTDPLCCTCRSPRTTGSRSCPVLHNPPWGQRRAKQWTWYQLCAACRQYRTWWCRVVTVQLSALWYNV